MNDLILSPAQQSTIRDFFSALKSQSISGFIARGGNLLPHRLDGRDLDIFICWPDLIRTQALLLDAAKKNNLTLIHRHTRSYFSAFWFRQESPGYPDALHIDLYPGAFTWKGLPFLKDEDVLSDIRKHNEFPFPSPHVEVISLMLTSVLWGGFFKVRYAERIRTLLACGATRKSVVCILKDRFATDESLIDDIAGGIPSETRIKKHTRTLRRGLIKQSFAKMPLRATRGIVSYLLGEINAWIRPPGLCIAILGADGAGKSLLLQNLYNEVSPLFGAIDSFHWRPSILPDVGVLLKRRKAAPATIVSDPHARPPHGRINSLLRLLYYLADYYLGFLLLVWPAKARNHLIIFDRFAEDMAVDPLRYRLRLPRFWLDFLCSLTPHPEITFVLTAPVSVLFARKQEVSKDELAGIVSRLKALACDHDRFRNVDCNRAPNFITSEVVTAIRATLMSRISLKEISTQ